MIKNLWLNYLIWFTLLTMILTISTSLIHPVPMISLMLVYNMILCFNMNLLKSNPLFPIMFFMIMISGLLIIFLYFSSLISNEKTMNLMKKSTTITMMINFIYLIIIMNMPNSMMSFNLPPSNLNIINMNLMKSYSPTSLIYSPPYINLTMMCMIYLIITLISVIKACTPNIKTLRKIK